MHGYFDVSRSNTILKMFAWIIFIIYISKTSDFGLIIRSLHYLKNELCQISILLEHRRVNDSFIDILGEIIKVGRDQI